MSIYIDGIKMPEKMTVFVVFPNGYTAVYDASDTFIGEAKAVLVPPHGRLIDADALDIYRREEQAYNEYKICPEEYFEGVASGLHEAAKCISTAPTIIPAEEEA